MKSCIYAGVFDPPHLGHMDIINRLSKTFDRVVVAVLSNAAKSPTMNAKSRVQLVSKLFCDNKKISVQAFDGLLTDFAKAKNISVIARGIRNTQDLEYEKQLSEIYLSQNSDLSIIYLLADPRLAHINSSTVKELIRLRGDISSFVHQTIQEEIKRSYN